MTTTFHPGPPQNASSAPADAFGFTKPYGPAQALHAAAVAGVGSNTIVWVGDSTGNADTEPPRLIAGWLTDLLPDHASAVYCLFDDTSQDYATKTVLKAGDGSGDIVLVDTFDRADGDAGEASGSTSGQQTWSGGWVASNKLTPLIGGQSTIRTYTDDINGTIKCAPPASGDARIYMHISDVDNCVFVQISSAIGVLRLYKRVGGVQTQIATVNKALVAGTEYDVSFRCAGPVFTAGISGGALSPASISGTVSIPDLAAIGPTDDYLGLQGASGTTFDDLMVRAEPTLTFLNGCVGGAAPAYQYDATRFPKIAPYTPDLFVVQHSHNMGNARNVDQIDTLVDLVASTYPGTPVALSTQNPETPLRTDHWHRAAHAYRQKLIRTFAHANGFGLIDAHARFLDDDPDMALYDADGTHQNEAGSVAWANEVKRLFGSAERV